MHFQYNSDGIRFPARKTLCDPYEAVSAKRQTRHTVYIEGSVILNNVTKLVQRFFGQCEETGGRRIKHLSSF
jgi:hypothetical protein